MSAPSVVPGHGPAVPGLALLSGGAAWEVALLPVLERHGAGAHLVRRCVDLADLLAVSAAGAVRVAVVDARLPRLDRDVVSRLHGYGVAVLAVAAAGADAGAALDLGVADIALATDAPTEILARARSVAGRSAASAPPPCPEPSAEQAGQPTAPAGRLLAVWGPPGAPGRSTVAVNLAAELALAGRQVLLVDADAAGGAVATLLGILDEAPGVAAAARAATRGRLDPESLAALAVALDDRLRVLTGSGRPDRWRELRPAALDVVWEVARTLADDVVVDVGAGLVGDLPDPLEPLVPGPGTATRSALAAADEVLAVAGADPVGLLRLVHGMDVLATADLVVPRVVVNRVRASVLGPQPRHQVRQGLARHCGLEPLALLPDDPRAADAALRAGRPLAEAAPTAPLRRAIADLAAQLAPSVDRRGSPGRRRSRRQTRRRGRSLPSTV
jgi:Flp pilus assembly CpaE family ATPase